MRRRLCIVAAALVAALVFGANAKADTPVGSATLSPSLSSYSQTVNVPDSAYPNGQLTFTLTQNAETPDTATALDSQMTGEPALNLTCVKGGAAAEVKYKNAGISVVTLWTYAQVIIFKHCSWVNSTGLHGKITKIYNFFDEALDSCCGWGWNGDVVTPQHSSLPTDNLATYTKGNFSACLPWPINLCENKYPWIRLHLNGFGKRTSFTWGT